MKNNTPPKFYNKTRLNGQELSEAIIKANSQERLTEIFFRANPKCEYTRSELYSVMVSANLLNIATPEQSLNRVLSNLISRNIIEKTDKLRPGFYGKKQRVHRLIS